MKNFLFNRPIKAGDEIFDSLAELRRYNELRELEESGAINNLARRVKFVLVPDIMELETRTANGVKIPGSRTAEKGIVLRADFVYRTKNGRTVAEIRRGSCKDADVKRKLMLYKYKAMVNEY